jgi:hypothetical protein
LPPLELLQAVKLHDSVIQRSCFIFLLLFKDSDVDSWFHMRQ